MKLGIHLEGIHYKPHNPYRACLLHVCLLHAGPTLLSASLASRYHIVKGHTTIPSVYHQCIAYQPTPKMIGELLIEWVICLWENRCGLCWSAILTNLGHTLKLTIVKSYICVFVSLTVKAVPFEVVYDLTTEAFIACLRRFIAIARRGKLSLIWSDDGTNFIDEITQFLNQKATRGSISDYLSLQRIERKFIRQRAPCLWEAAVKSIKKHLRKVTGEVKHSCGTDWSLFEQ